MIPDTTNTRYTINTKNTTNTKNTRELESEFTGGDDTVLSAEKFGFEFTLFQ